MMEEFRSRSYGDGRTSEMEIQYGNGSTTEPTLYAITGMQDLRSYSTSVHPTRTRTQTQFGSHDEASDNDNKDPKLKKAKSTNRWSSRSWSLSDPDLPRKKRVAGYKVYTVEGKLKGSLRKSFRWIKDRCTKLTHGL